jgi:WD40 repeat protein
LVDIVFSPDGKYLATECRKNTTYLWDVKVGRELKRFELNDTLEALTFRPDGKYLAIASFDRKALIWDLDQEEKVWEHKLATFAASLDYSPDGRYLAIASGYEAFVLNLTNNMEICRVVHDNIVNDVEFSPDGKNIATASCDNTARLWSINTGREIARMVHSDYVNSLTFSPDGKYIATASRDGTARIWQASGWEGLESFKSKVGTIDTALMSPDGRHLLTSVKRMSTCWNLSGDQPEIIGGFYQSTELNFAIFSPQSKYLALNFLNRTTLVLNFSSSNYSSNSIGDCAIKLEDDENLSVMAFSPDNRLIATASMNNVTNVYDLLNGKSLLEVPLDNLVISMAFNHDASRLIIVTLNGESYVYDLITGQRIRHLSKKNVDIRGAILSPDARYLAINYYNDTRLNETMALSWVDVYDLETGNTTMVSAFEPNQGTLPAFSSSSKYLMAPSFSSVIIWDLATGKIIKKISENRLADTCAMSPDDKYLTVAYLDYPNMQCTIKIWELDTGRELFVIPEADILKYLFFTPDGENLATINLNGEFRFWPIHPEEIIKETCAHLDLNTALNEWVSYFGNVLYKFPCECAKDIKPNKRFQGAAAPILEATPTLVEPGDKIALKYYDVPDNTNGYIMICPVGIESEKCYGEFYPLNESTSGEMTFPVPVEIGRYQFRLLPNPRLGFDEIASSNPISVASNVTSRTYFKDNSVQEINRNGEQNETSLLSNETSMAILIDSNSILNQYQNLQQEAQRRMWEIQAEMILNHSIKTNISGINKTNDDSSMFNRWEKFLAN